MNFTFKTFFWSYLHTESHLIPLSYKFIQTPYPNVFNVRPLELRYLTGPLTEPPVAQSLLLHVAFERSHFLQLRFLALGDLLQPPELLLLSSLLLLPLVLLLQKLQALLLKANATSRPCHCQQGSHQPPNSLTGTPRRRGRGAPAGPTPRIPWGKIQKAGFLIRVVLPASREPRTHVHAPQLQCKRELLKGGQPSREAAKW